MSSIYGESVPITNYPNEFAKMRVAVRMWVIATSKIFDSLGRSDTIFVPVNPLRLFPSPRLLLIVLVWYAYEGQSQLLSKTGKTAFAYYVVAADVVEGVTDTMPTVLATLVVNYYHGYTRTYIGCYFVVLVFAVEQFAVCS